MKYQSNLNTNRELSERKIRTTQSLLKVGGFQKLQVRDFSIGSCNNNCKLVERVKKEMIT